MKPPIAKRIAHERALHDRTWTDHYHWLRADNWQACVDDPSVLPEPIKQYLQDENEWFTHVMADTEDLQAKLLVEMRGRIQDVEQSLPDEKDGWSYLERFEAGDEYPRFLRCRSSDVPQGSAMPDSSGMQLLIDFNKEASRHEYFDYGDYAVSPAHTHLAWGADTNGSERYSLRVRDLSTQMDEDVLENTSEVVWGNSQYLFYTQIDADHRPNRVYRHRLGSAQSEDVLVFEESDTRFFCSVSTSASERYVFISTEMNEQSEYWYIPTDDICAAPVIIEPRAEDVEYEVEHQGEQFLILTNADAAHDFKIVVAPCTSPGRANWTDWLGHRPGVMALNLSVYHQWIMWMEREDALPRICYCHVTDEASAYRTVGFDQEAYALSLQPLDQFNQSTFRFSFQSPSTPEQTFAFDMQSGEKKLLKQDVLPSGHQSDDYTVRRLSAMGNDGVTVPVTLLYHKHSALDGSAPCLLDAYGAYGASSPAVFSSSILSLIDRGFVYALAHVRGGQEKGRAWYDAARGEHKQNTFDDVVAVAQHLISEQFTSTGNIVLSGASAGGLMVGAVLNQSEHLWAGAIADVPFVDVINTLIDEKLPLTPGEWSQWGNPLKNAQDFDTIWKYSPYDNVQARPYPPMLVTAGVSDPRVTYWEPAKWVAKHRYIRDDDASLIFKTNLSTGHFGATGRYASLQDEAIEYAFSLKVVGLG